MKNKFTLAGCFVLSAIYFALPWAHIKTVWWGVPLYIPEMFVILSALLYGTGWYISQNKQIAGSRVFFLGSALLLLGSVIAYALNPQSLTGLGMLKTWFFFPFMAAFLVLQCQDVKRLLLCWLLGILGIALASLPFLLTGQLTFDGRLAAWYSSPNFLAMVIAPGPLLLSLFS